MWRERRGTGGLRRPLSFCRFSPAAARAERAFSLPTPPLQDDHPRPLLHVRQGVWCGIARQRWERAWRRAGRGRRHRAPRGLASPAAASAAPEFLVSRPCPSHTPHHSSPPHHPTRSSATSGTRTWSCCRPTTRRREFDFVVLFFPFVHTRHRAARSLSLARALTSPSSSFPSLPLSVTPSTPSVCLGTAAAACS